MPHRKQQRCTPQRRVILEELRKVTSHPTAVELYELVRHRMPKISLGTVYRNLELLAENGMVKKLVLGGRETRFDGVVTPHYHVRCKRCDRVDDVSNLPEDLVTEPPREVAGYWILEHHLELIGLCPECRRTMDGSPMGDRSKAAERSQALGPPDPIPGRQ